MSKKHKSDKLQSISLAALDAVTGGVGTGPGPAHRHRQPAQQTWASLVPASLSSFGSAAPNPWAALAGTRPAGGQAGTAGTPGAYVHNGKFRPL